MQGLEEEIAQHCAQWNREREVELVSLLDGDGFARYISKEFMDVLGLAPEDLVGTCVFERVHPNDIACVTAQFGYMVAMLRRAVVDFRFLDKHRRWVSFHGYGEPFFRGGTLNGFIVVAYETHLDVKALLSNINRQYLATRQILGTQQRTR